MSHEDLRALVRTIPDFPKVGIQFRDITTLLRDKHGYKRAIDLLADRYREKAIDRVAGVEARGFILGGALAHALGAGFVPLRKKGKLPGAAVGESYDLEYGTDCIEIHVGAVDEGDRVLFVDDLVATGGTALAGLRLLAGAGAKVVEACFVIDLPELRGRSRIEAAGVGVFALMEFEGH